MSGSLELKFIRCIMLLVSGWVVLSFPLALAQSIDSRLTGTWSSKSNSTFTGPSFYDHIKDELFEPEHTGISYSFSEDGHYETAYYRAVSNPQKPSCPMSMLQWQHGTYQKLTNGSLSLQPFANDGRELFSDPCKARTCRYSRYAQGETIKWYEVYKDPYHHIMRLNLYRFDGSPLPVLYLVSEPPQMLPKRPLHQDMPSLQNSPRASPIKKRSLALAKMISGQLLDWVLPVVAANPNIWLWVGAGFTGVGGFLYFCF